MHCVIFTCGLAEGRGGVNETTLVSEYLIIIFVNSNIETNNKQTIEYEFRETGDERDGFGATATTAKVPHFRRELAPVASRDTRGGKRSTCASYRSALRHFVVGFVRFSSHSKQ